MTLHIQSRVYQLSYIVNIRTGPGPVLSLFGLKDHRTGPFKKAKTVDTLFPIHCFPIEHCDTIDFSLLFLCLEDFPEEDTDCQFAANFLDHKSVNMNEILCLDVGGDKYRDVDDEDTIYVT